MWQIPRTVLSLCLSLISTGLSAAEDLGPLRSPEAQRYLAPIQAYEALFTTCRMAYQEGAGGSQEAHVVLARLDTERVVDGPRAYVRSVAYGPGGEKVRTEVAVTDGKIQRVWRYRRGSSTFAIEKVEEEGIQPFTPFTRYVFQPSRGLEDAKHLELLEDRGEIVRLRFHRRGMYVDADFARHGDYLRITRLQSGSIDPEVSVAGTEYRYHYAPALEGDRELAPTKIEQISRMHGVHGVLEMKEVDLNPEISAGQFELEVPPGATVIDRTTEDE